MPRRYIKKVTAFVGKKVGYSFPVKKIIKKIKCDYIAFVRIKPRTRTPTQPQSLPLPLTQTQAQTNSHGRKQTVLFFVHFPHTMGISHLRYLLRCDIEIADPFAYERIIAMEGVEVHGQMGPRAKLYIEKRKQEAIQKKAIAQKEEQERIMRMNKWMPYQPTGSRGFWVYGQSGSGKTRTIMKFCELKKMQLFEKSGINKYFNGYKGEKAIAMHNIRSQHLQYLKTYMIQWADSNPVNGESKTDNTSVELHHDYFFISSCLTLEQCLSCQSESVKDLFMRRYEQIPVKDLQSYIQKTWRIPKQQYIKPTTHMKLF